MSIDVDTTTESPAEPAEPATEEPTARRGPSRLSRVLAFGVLPAVVIALALGVGYLKWQSGAVTQSDRAAAQVVAVATETTIAILGYQPDTVEQDLHAATGRLTGTFRDEYIQLIDEVVIPGAKEKRVAAAVTVPAAATISADERRAEVLLFVNQETSFGDEAPSSSVSSVKVTLQKDNDQWLVSQFEPV